MKYALLLVVGLILNGTALAQENDIDGLKAQIEQQKAELEKLRGTIKASTDELESVKGKIADSDGKIDGINDKIKKLCDELAEAAGGSENNPACQ